MNKSKITFSLAILTTLFACTPSKSPQSGKTGYLKYHISQAELNHPAYYKRYHYTCHNMETGEVIYLSNYFPLSKESRQKEHFGFYFQLNNGNAEPFDHLENKELNTKGSHFEVIYRSYRPIQGSYIDLVASPQNSTYYKNQQGVRLPWLKCREN